MQIKGLLLTVLAIDKRCCREEGTECGKLDSHFQTGLTPFGFVCLAKVSKWSRVDKARILAGLVGLIGGFLPMKERVLFLTNPLDRIRLALRISPEAVQSSLFGNYSITTAKNRDEHYRLHKQ